LEFKRLGDLMPESERADGDGRLRRQHLVAFDPALGYCLADGFLDLALGGDADLLQKLPDAGVEDILVHDRLLSVSLTFVPGEADMRQVAKVDLLVVRF
jgi:hypothetical protein